MVGDASERFGKREAEKLHFLGLKERRDANKRSPGDANYVPKTLYLPPFFLKSLSDGQGHSIVKIRSFFNLEPSSWPGGEQPHCGFPGRNFSMNVKSAQKGYQVLVVEQTETPEQLELRWKEKGSKDKVVKREICAVVTKGTLTEGEMLSSNPDPSYLMAVTESCQSSTNQFEEQFFGAVDVATNRIILGQFGDDSECSALCCLLTELRPVEIIKPTKLLSLETDIALLRHKKSLSE
ncbi:hypothetical protein DITRI_Ditri05aG0151900 [Diplodiscus trichospermus]